MELLHTHRKKPSPPFLWFTIKAADSLQRNKSPFFPFSREVKIGSNELLKNHEAEGVELRTGAKCPVRGHSPNNHPLLKPIASSEVPRFNNSLEGLTVSCYPHCYGLLHRKDTDGISEGRAMWVQRSANCIAFLASHRTREAHPSLGVQSFYWGSLCRHDWLLWNKDKYWFLPPVPNIWSLTLVPGAELLKPL